MNKKTYLISSAIVATLVVIAGVAGFFYYFGEAVAFSVTNRSQVLSEKADWNAYVSKYGQVAESPKAN